MAVTSIPDGELNAKICQLMQKLKEKDEELMQAGRYGKSMLETNSHLENILHESNCEYEKKIEELEQQKYSLEQKLEVFKKGEQQLRLSYCEENQALIAEHKKQISTMEQKFKNSLAECNQKLLEKQQEFDEIMCTNEQLNIKIEKQKSTIFDLKNSLRKPTKSESLAPELVEVMQENVKLEEESNALKEECEDMQNYIAHINTQMKELQKSNECLREQKDYTANELRSCSDALEECQFEKLELKREIEELKSQPQDPNSRGNSLFAEVDDRRVLAEKNLVNIKVKLKSMEKKYTQQVNYAMKLKTQIAQLLQFGGRDADRERISRLEQALMSSQSDAKLLTHKVVDLEAKLSDKSNRDLNEIAMKSQDEPLNEFFQSLLKKKEGAITQLSDQLRQCQIELLAESRRLIESDRDVYDAQIERDNLKAQLVKLRIEISRLKLKCGEEVQDKRDVKARKTEKVPVETTVDSPLSERNTKENYATTNGCTEESAHSMNNIQSKKSSDPAHGLTECPQECKQQ